MERSEKLAVESRSGIDDAAREADLLARARQGHAGAWEALVREHQQPVFRLAYLTLGSSHATTAEAEDVAQETFLRAFEKLDQFDTSRALRPWLLTIAANLARNRRRGAGRYWAALRRWWQSERAVQAVQAPTQAERDDAQLLWQAVQQLSPDHRQALYLRYFLEMPEAEIAAVLEVAPGTVKSRLYRARSALQNVLREEYPLLYAEWKQS